MKKSRIAITITPRVYYRLSMNNYFCPKAVFQFFHIFYQVISKRGQKVYHKFTMIFLEHGVGYSIKNLSKSEETRFWATIAMDRLQLSEDFLRRFGSKVE